MPVQRTDDARLDSEARTVRTRAPLHHRGPAGRRPASPGALGTIRVVFSVGIDTATFTPADVALIGPTGARITVTAVKLLPRTNNKVWNVVVPRQTRVGTYQFRIGADVRSVKTSKRLTPFQTTFRVTAP